MSYDKAISYSGKSLYKKCPYLWADSYIHGNRSPGNAASERGTNLHDQLEKFFKGLAPYPSGDKCLSKWQPFMEELKSRAPSAEAEAAVDSNWNAVPFDSPLAHFRGKKDLDDEVGGVKIIYDWKSGKIYPDHVEQGKAYVALDQAEWEQAIARFVYLDIPHHVAEWKYTRQDQLDFREQIDEEIHIIRMDEEYRATPSDQCRWCKFNWRSGGSCTTAP